MPKKATLNEAIKLTHRYQWEKLLEQETRWRRKVTIATNKLAAVLRAKDKFAVALIDKVEVERLQ